MTFRESIETCLIKKFLTIKGRASRSEFWYFFLFSIIVSIILVFAGGIAFTQSNTAGIAIFSLLGIYWLGAFIPSITVSIRRFHDLDKSGFWYLIVFFLGLIPLVGFISSIGMLIYFASKGTEGNNRFDEPQNATFSLDNAINLLKEDFNNIFSKSNNTSQPAATSPTVTTSKPATTPPKPTASVPSEDNLEKLQKLHELKEKGILTEEEFQSQKKNILGN